MVISFGLKQPVFIARKNVEIDPDVFRAVGNYKNEAAFTTKLSTVVSINEQFARSTRIDEDDINAMGFIYSESIDLFLRTLIRHQSKSQQGSVYLDWAVWEWQIYPSA